MNNLNEDTNEKIGATSLPSAGIFGELAVVTKEAGGETHNKLENTKKPPYSEDAERGVLSAILLEADAFDQVSLEGLKADHFYHPANSTIFSAMQSLHERSEPIDTVTVVNELVRMQALEQVGGVAMIAKLEALFPTAAHVIAYTHLIQEKAILRRLVKTASLIVHSAFRQDRKAIQVIDEAEQAILAIRNDTSQAGIFSIKDLAQKAMEHYEALKKNERPIIGVPSGFHDLDELTCGFQPGELIIVAARPSMGKTAFTLNIAANVALRAKLPVAFFSLEMSADQLINRLIGAEARLNLTNLRRGNIPENEYMNLVVAAGLLGKAPIYIDESPSLNISEMRNKCRRLHHKHGIELIIVDYLQLMNGPQGYDNKAIEIGEISKGLKAIARELRVPVIALSQLNRGVESRTDKRPMMSDLRESGAIEQDADVISFLYREDYYLRDKTPDEKKGVAEIIIAKNRNGPTGSLELKFFSEITRFVDLDRDHRDYRY